MPPLADIAFQLLKHFEQFTLLLGHCVRFVALAVYWIGPNPFLVCVPLLLQVLQQVVKVTG